MKCVRVCEGGRSGISAAEGEGDTLLINLLHSDCLHVFVKFRSLDSWSIHCNSLSILSWYLTREGQKGPQVRDAYKQCTVVYCGILWYTVVYCGIL